MPTIVTRVWATMNHLTSFQDWCVMMTCASFFEGMPKVLAGTVQAPEKRRPCRCQRNMVKFKLFFRQVLWNKNRCRTCRRTFGQTVVVFLSWLSWQAGLWFNTQGDDLILVPVAVSPAYDKRQLRELHLKQHRTGHVGTDCWNGL